MFSGKDMLALKKTRNGEVSYLLEKGVVVESELLEEEDFLFLFFYSLLHCLIRREHHPSGHHNACLSGSLSCFFLPLLWQTPVSENLDMLDYFIQIIAYMNKCNSDKLIYQPLSQLCLLGSHFIGVLVVP
jgi:hypothetical protein